MHMTTRAPLVDLVAAVTEIRRLWESPRVRRRFTELLGRSVEFSVIRTLAAVQRSTAPDPGVRDVAEALHVDSSTASRFVDQAVADGFVERSASAVDRRRCVLALTSEGNALLTGVTNARIELMAGLTADWGDADVATLATGLERLAGSISALERQS
ncbi:MAG: MarR family winged helix-turn-helix transcriptional regulator [Actinomycetota bacterium]|nr:MarR family winged helix-turn-helix transcriptional regulator [Actinomycetota bacterium]